MHKDEIVTEEVPELEELYEKLSIIIDRGQEPLRIDKFLMQRIEGATRNKIQQAIEDEMVLVNEKPVKKSFELNKPYAANKPPTECPAITLSWFG